MQRQERQESTVQTSVVIFLLFITIILGFGTGFVVNGFLNSAGSGYEIAETGENVYDTQYINNIISTVDQRYLEEVPTSRKDITYEMVKGFISSLDDRYTTFYTPEEAEEYFQQSAGNFEGVGITISYNDELEYTYIETVLKGNPAEQAGLLPQDIIVAVDGEDTSDSNPSEVASLIRGEKGTEVTIDILRENSSGSFEDLSFDVTRNLIDLDSITWEKIDDETVLIDIVQFSDDSSVVFNQKWDNVVSEIEAEEGVNDVIVDLRNNPGGYVSSVIYVLEEFLDDGDVIMKERNKETIVNEYKDDREGAFEDKDIVVLVNEGSASASEIFAAAIQENEKGEIVGMPTVGKGVEQELIDFSDGSLLLLVFQEWLTPNENRISPENPIAPDFEVDLTIEDFRNDRDPQLDKAIEEAKN